VEPSRQTIKLRSETTRVVADLIDPGTQSAQVLTASIHRCEAVALAIDRSWNGTP
jgi:hypothetical protein